MRAIVTVVGKDQVGIIANVCTRLAAYNINILDISQTVIDGYFNMIMITDISGATKPLAEIASAMAEAISARGLVEPEMSVIMIILK